MKKLVSIVAVIALLIGVGFRDYHYANAAESLADVSVTPRTLTKGTATSVDVVFTTPVAVPVDAEIIITFPFYYGVSDVTGVNSDILDGGLSYNVVNLHELHITRNGDGQEVAVGTVVNDLELFNVVTPPIEDYAGAYAVSIEDSLGNVLVSGSATGHTFQDSQLIPAAPATITLSTPNGGEKFVGDETTTISWLSTGLTPIYRLEFSSDGGSSYTVIADNIFTETYSWVVPNIGVEQGKIRVVAVEYGSDIKSDVSDANFSVTNTQETVVVDGNITEVPHNSLIKSESLPAVYFLGSDAKRYVFPSEQVFYSWYDNFDDVITVSDDVMASFTLGSRITIAPGSLIKVQSDPKVYAIDSDGSKRHITTEQIAKEKFGVDWANRVVDIDVTQWFDYETGADIDIMSGMFAPVMPSFPVSL